MTLFRLRQPLFEIALCFALGIVLSDRLCVLSASLAPLLWQSAGGFAAAILGLLLFQKTQGKRRGSSSRNASLLWVLFLFAGCAWGAYYFDHLPARRLAIHLPAQGTPAEGEGIVLNEPNEYGRLMVRLDWIILDGERWDLPAKVRVIWPRGAQEPTVLPRYGDRVSLKGTLKNFSGARNPGEFDNAAYRKRQGVYSLLSIRYPDDAQIVAHDQGNRLVAVSLALRHWMEGIVALDLEDSPEVAAVIQSIVLGSQVQTPREVEDLFRYTGTIHLFSVSGVHVAMLAALAYFLFQMLGIPRRWVAPFLLPILWGYCILTGLAAATLRATLMASIACIGVSLDRATLAWNTVGASALLILLLDPNELFMPGFQLSFLLVLILFAGTKPLEQIFNRWGQPDPFLPKGLWTPLQRGQSWISGHFALALAVSTAAWVGSLGLTIGYFNLFSPSSIPANLIAGFLSSVILAYAVASAFFGGFWPGLSIIINNANWLFTKALLGALSFLASIPGSHSYVEAPSLARKPIFEATILDLHLGGAAHLRVREGGRTRDWLVDTGHRHSAEWTTLPYLRTRGVDALDGVFLSHGDAQHIGGMEMLLDRLPIEEVFESPYRDRSRTRRAIHARLAEREAGKLIMSRGDSVLLSPCLTVKVLYPPTGLPLRAADDKALILRFDIETSHGKRSLLFTSDAGFYSEQWLLENAAPAELRADFLIKGAHPNDLSGTPDFLKAVGPSILIAAAGEAPAERLSPEWIKRVEASGISLMRQDQTGAVTLKIYADGSWSAQGFADPLRFRSNAR